MQQVQLTPEETTAGQVRVKPEELVQAIASLEERRAAITGQQMDTIAIGEAIQQLGLDMTPEELLMEIHTRRAVVPLATPVQTHKRSKRPFLLMGILAGAGAVLLLGIYLARSSFQPTLLAPVMANAEAAPAFWPPSEPRIALADLLPEMEAYVSGDDLYLIARGEAGQNLLPSLSQNLDNFNGPQWQLVKRDGKLFVKGWSSSELEGAIKNLTSAKIDTQQHPLLIPVERFRNAKVVDMIYSFYYTSEMPDPHPGQIMTFQLPAPKEERR